MPRRRRIKVILPQEIYSAYAPAEHIFAKNVKAIEECDVLVAILDQALEKKVPGGNQLRHRGIVSIEEKAFSYRPLHGRYFTVY
jgi:hypothetical protein